jgi:predicted RND superfamily exporter protein
VRQWGERLFEHRRSAVLVILVLTAFFAWQARHLVIATNFRDLYPANHPYTKLFKKYPQFGSPLSVYLVIQVKTGTIYDPQTLAKIQEATRRVDLIAGVDHNQVLSIASAKIKHVEATNDGIRSTNFLIGPIPQNSQDLETLRDKIRSSPEVLGVWVSPQEDAALIQASFVERLVEYQAIFDATQKIITTLGDRDHEIYAAGQPLLSGWVYFYKRQTLAIFAATLFGMILLLAVHVRNLAGSVTPIIVSFVTAIWGLGIAAVLKINLDPLMLVLPMLLIARSFSHAIQACERYFEIYAATQNQKEACIGSLVSIFPPGVLGILTDAAGLFFIAIAPIPVIEKIAIVSGCWALSLIPANVLLTPIVLSFLPPPRNAAQVLGQVSSRRNAGWLSAALAAFNRVIQRTLTFIYQSSRGQFAWVTGLMLLVAAIWSALAIRQLPLGDSHHGTSLLWPEAAYNTAVGKINERFPGFDILQVVQEIREPQISIQHPASLEVMQRFQRYMELDPDVAATFSFADLVTATNRLLHGGLPKWGVVPENQADAAMISQLALSGAGPGDSDRLFTRDLTAANINVWYKDHRSETVERALQRAKAFQYGGQIQGPSAVEFRLASGTFGLIGAVNETVARSQLEILLLVLAMIFVMCSVTYKSILAALILLVPVNFSNLTAAGLMAYMNIGLDVNTLPVLAVGTGVGIDYAIYLMSRICEEYPLHNDYDETLFHAILTTGRAIVFTASTLVLGMAPWYFLSSLRFQANMGLLIAALMVINMIAALVVIPLLVSILKPKFIARRAKLLQIR